MAKRSPASPKHELWHPPAYTDMDIRAIQSLALFAHTAITPPDPANPIQPPSASEVKRALDWIINMAAATYDNGFTGDDPGGRIGAFMDGRQFVGQQIIKLMKLKPGLFEKDK